MKKVLEIFFLLLLFFLPENYCLIGLDCSILNCVVQLKEGVFIRSFAVLFNNRSAFSVYGLGVTITQQLHYFL